MMSETLSHHLKLVVLRVEFRSHVTFKDTIRQESIDRNGRHADFRRRQSWASVLKNLRRVEGVLGETL